MYLKTVIEIDCNIQITFMYVCDMYCTEYATWDKPSLLYFNKEYVTCNSNENTIAFAPSPPTISSVCTICSEWVGARSRTLKMQNRNAISTCGSQSFVLSNLFLWQNRKRELHSISQHFHKFAIKTKFNELCSFLTLLLNTSISNGSSTNKTDILFRFFSCVCVCLSA